MTGGIVLLSPKKRVLYKAVMPVKDKLIDLERLTAIFTGLSNEEVYIFIEDVTVITRLNSATTALSMGRQLGVFDYLFWDLQFDFQMIPPIDWQNEMLEGTDKNLKTKVRCNLVYEKLYADVDLTPTDRSKKSHGGMIDALLIAEFGRRVLKEAHNVH